ncbi:MAG: polysaccharide pyruvyl transferase family protein [Paludibacter sp.]|nr:polysaccharide pyruvyl transferase family protein [Paludibacter sp.]
MKIGILTQPLSTNYGGLLQAYALQYVLKNMGHEVLTIDKQAIDLPFRIKLLSVVKRLSALIMHNSPNLIRVWATAKERNIIAKNTNRFIKDNISTTTKIGPFKKLSFLKKYNFDAYIVGSDQVWRLKYSPCILDYFLDFCNNQDKIKRIAYAASFGVENWEFPKKLTEQSASLSKKFDAISVREDSAVELCKNYMGVQAVRVLDPTMLLTKEDYIGLVEKENIPKNRGSLMIYVLDKSNENNETIQQVTQYLNLESFSVMAKNSFYEVGKNKLEGCIFPSVTEWIRGFMDAEYVITDSFHGTVFSILFNKPFLSIGNIDRGITRFTSLLNLFGLEDRLILSKYDLTEEKIKAPIDFTRVNKILNKEKKKANIFLLNALNN